MVLAWLMGLMHFYVIVFIFKLSYIYPLLRGVRLLSGTPLILSYGLITYRATSSRVPGWVFLLGYRLGYFKTNPRGGQVAEH